MADYLVKEDGSSKFSLENSSGFILLETSTDAVAAGAGIAADLMAVGANLLSPTSSGPMRRLPD